MSLRQLQVTKSGSARNHPPRNSPILGLDATTPWVEDEPVLMNGCRETPQLASSGTYRLAHYSGNDKRKTHTVIR